LSHDESVSSASDDETHADRAVTTKAYYQAFFRVLIDLIVELFGLIIKPFDNQTES